MSASDGQFSDTGRAQTNSENGLTERNLTYERDFCGEWLLVNVATRLHGRSFTLIGMHVYCSSRSLGSLNRSTLIGKSPLLCATRVLMVFVITLTVHALSACVRARPLRHNGLWIAFVPVGVGNFSDNSTSRRSGMHGLTVPLFSVSTFSAPYGRWIVAVSIPLDASVCPLRQRHQSARSRAARH